jgi:lipopolysaccharide/colanic/teichoic acid biosynthesis glycosyltransferase
MEDERRVENINNRVKEVDTHYYTYRYAVPQPIIRPSGFYHFVKRAIDIIGSGIGLILLSPIFLVVGLLVKKDGGPAFYSQDRVGRNGRIFKIWKFRSMVMNADAMLKDLMAQNEIEGAMFKMKDDPRITKVGKFIRRVSIDELPQLWNVFVGDMSLVGPRPPITREVDIYDDWAMTRLTVKPGMSGLWQVGPRNEVDFDDMVAIDLEYVANQSIRQDIKILFLTVGVVIGPVISKGSKKSAY